MHLAQRRNELVSFDLMLTVIAINVALIGGARKKVWHCVRYMGAILVVIMRCLPTAFTPFAQVLLPPCAE